VLYADMVGYSRLIGLDDAGTLARLKALRGPDRPGNRRARRSRYAAIRLTCWSCRHWRRADLGFRGILHLSRMSADRRFWP